MYEIKGTPSNFAVKLTVLKVKPLRYFHVTGVITLSCGIKISAVCPFVSSQSTRVTDGQTDGQNFDF